MKLIELEPARINEIQKWWMKPEAGELLACLEKRAQMSMIESMELRTKAKSDNDNPNYANAAEEKLAEAAEFETAVKVLKSFFPDGPFVARIEL